MPASSSPSSSPLPLAGSQVTGSEEEVRAAPDMSARLAPGTAVTTSPEPRRSRALWAGIVMVALACALLGVGSYAFLASIRVFDVIFQGAGLISWPSVAVVVTGASLAFVAVVISIVAMVRTRPRTMAAVLVLASLVLPAAAMTAGGHYGTSALKDHTMDQALKYAGRVEPEQVDTVLGKVEALGVPIPWRDEIIKTVRSAKDIVS
ncbi:hypothetical protein HMPREF2883_11085 [Actinomyces sp. HMSC075C01]|uniref:Uncharacterized protein n=1 Tax=Actinomyces oris TaxID=544580 RepID=A0A1Q8W2L1_9ACTO|nr:hypothetical protein HMPREF2883_11085 [Actinomyces sp. HMSC075C01]OLO55714.1 hypothetical protein BKH27_00890 [Actinomyces oris]